VIVGLGVMLGLLAAALQTTASGGPALGAWLVGLAIGLGALMLIGRLTYVRRQRTLRLGQRRSAARRRAQAHKPPVYLEVIESKAPDERGSIWAVEDFALTIGRGAQVDVPLRDKGLARRHCLIFYDDDDGRYYLENLDHHLRTVLYDRPLRRGETMPLSNGDLLMLGKGLVLQFRIADNEADRT
jgi:hypothetical protein